MDVERVEPESEHSSLALAFCVKVLDLKLVLFGDRIKTGMGVEEIGDESEVKLGVSCDKGSWGQELAAVQLIGVV